MGSVPPELSQALVLSVFTVAVGTAGVQAWLALSNLLAHRSTGAAELRLYTAFAAASAGQAATVAASFVGMEPGVKILVFRLMWVFGIATLATWLLAVPRFLDVEAPMARLVARALGAVALLPLADVLAGALGHPFFLLPGPRETASVLMAATGNVYHHGPLADLAGMLLVLGTVAGGALLLRAIARSGQAEPILVFGVLASVVACVVETGMAVVDAEALAPLMFAASLLESMRITYASNREVVVRLAASRREQEVQRALLAEQMARMEELRRLAEVGSRTAEITHDIRNPLAAADLALEHIESLSSELSGERRAELIDVIESTRRSLDRGLLLLQRITRQGAARRESKVLDLQQLLTDSLAMSLHRLRDVRVEKEFPDGPLLVRGDRVDLVQVFVNLLVNAGAAVEEAEEPWIRIRARRFDGLACVEVVDAGRTPTEQVRRQMFASGFTTRAQRGGTGLGLEICRRVVEAHGGAVSLDEGAEHTTFQVLLPEVGGPGANRLRA